MAATLWITILWIAIIALVLGCAALAWAARVWWRVRPLRLDLGPGAGPLLERLGTVGRRLETLETGQVGLRQALGRAGLHPAVLHYAPLGMGGARNSFVLALLNRGGDGVVLNYLAGSGIRADLKEVRGWQSQGLAFTAEEEQAVAANRAWWG